jgi:hypothetical protein
MLLGDVRFESVAGWAELVTVGTGEAHGAKMFCLNVITDCCGIAGRVVAVCAAVQPAAATQHLALYGRVQSYEQ